MVEIVIDKLRQADPDVKIETNQLIGGRVKASVCVESKSGGKHVVEILENEIAIYTRGEDNERKMRQRGRLAEKVAKQNGCSGYSCVSYIELEYALDEKMIFEGLVHDILGQQSKLPKVSSHAPLHDKKKRSHVLD